MESILPENLDFDILELPLEMRSKNNTPEEQTAEGKRESRDDRATTLGAEKVASLEETVASESSAVISEMEDMDEGGKPWLVS